MNNKLLFIGLLIEYLFMHYWNNKAINYNNLFFYYLYILLFIQKNDKKIFINNIDLLYIIGINQY